MNAKQADLKDFPNYQEINSLTLMLFLINDIQETNLLNLLQEFKKQNFRFKTEIEHKTNVALKTIQALKKPISKIDIEHQYQFGDVADMMYQLIYNIYLVTGGYPDKLEDINKLVLEYAKKNVQEENTNK